MRRLSVLYDRYLVSLLSGLSSGILLNLANEPVGWGILGLIALAPLYRHVDGDWKQRLVAGWLAGFLLQAFGYHWIFGTIRDFGGQSSWISALGALGFQLYQGFDIALWMLLVPIVKHLPLKCRPFGAAACWLLVQEFLFPYTFPWHYGNIFVNMVVLRESAVYLGATGIALLTITMQGYFFQIDQFLRSPVGYILAFLILLGILPRTPPETETWRIGVVQPNLIALSKSGLRGADFFKAHYDMSQRFKNAQLDLLVWPETALPFDLNNNPAYYRSLQELTRSLNAPLITGTVEIPERHQYYNAIWMIQPEGEPQKYRKEKLVAFSEAVPWYLSWIKYFTPNMGGFLVGEDNQPFRYRNREFVPLVCFEALFPDYTRKRRGHLILNLTNDAWFGETAASSQHLQQIRLRAVENGVPLIRATNSGITCWIDPQGRIRDAGTLYQPETFIYQVPVPRDKPRTLSVYGTWLSRGAGLALLLWAVIRRRKPGPVNNPSR